MGNLGKGFHYLDRDCRKDRIRPLSRVHTVKTKVCPYLSCNRENSNSVEGKKNLPQVKAATLKQMPREDAGISIHGDFHNMIEQDTEQPD